MNVPAINVSVFAPELALMLSIGIILIADLFVPEKSRTITYALALLAAVIAGALAATGIGAETATTFGGMFISDPMSSLLKVFASLATFTAFIYSRQYAADRGFMKGEFYVLGLASLLGQMVMISSHNLLVIYLGLELMSLALYALVALRRDSVQATEAAMKYFVLGALASGFLLYGISMIYGGAGSLDLAEIASAAASDQINEVVMVFGAVFLVAGIAFKLSAAPFHMWAPDVYEGSPTAVTLLIAGGPKLAAFAMIMRLLVDGLVPFAPDWQQMIGVLAVVSLAVGNLTAIAQTNIKRMLAYSAIGQIGFMLLGFMSGVVVGATPESVISAYSASMYYAIVYVITTLGSFGVLMLLARKDGDAGFDCVQIDDLKGLNRRSPWMAFVMLLLMFSLAGIPPTVGFYAKLAVLEAAIAADHLYVAIFAVMFSLVGAFYYLRVVKVMYFDEPTHNTPIQAPADASLALALNGALILLLGLFGDGLMLACLHSIKLAIPG
ncbi:NADH-quinone oxidoreductase subunit NuoN [Derxia gummosa]|uniref:NADH-quinone oxidoreductase subunit N n=1 Tax=Derxia gummosa DSM 723 TaxID=1121388 RepID=A0A8B6X705_9BURK|nr:NADH-quinone oxidoreductase subunit NuoN [Derxia gummosa]